ncbi:MAG: HAMP domain-containing protein [Spirochaetales bacterium]|nr:HAMP domain-containing protein [Spirochaetales bacterium]
MSIEIILALIIIITAAALFGIFKIIFKKSILFRIAVSNLLSVAVVAYIGFMIGLRGLEMLYWAFPLGMGIIFAAAFILKKSIYDPIRRIEKKMDDISKGGGDLTESIDINTEDEIGRLSNAYNEFIMNLSLIINNLKQVSEQSRGIGDNLATNSEETASTIEEISTTVTSMQQKITILDTEIDKTKATTDVLNQFITEVGNMIQNQSASVSESSSSIQEMISSIHNIEKTIVDKKKASDALESMAIISGEEMTETISAIQDIATSAETIQQLNNLIDDVARQTNLLALNASIEAAHAGEEGKGFNVVAEEIRKLAEATATNARNISESVGLIIQKITATAISAEKTGKQTEKLINGIHEISQSMNETLQGIQEINTGSYNITESLTQLIEITEQVRGTSQQMIKGTEEINNSMNQLTELSVDNNHGMSEIASGMSQIANSALLLSEMSTQNAGSIEILETEIMKFKTK